MCSVPTARTPLPQTGAKLSIGQTWRMVQIHLFHRCKLFLWTFFHFARLLVKKRVRTNALVSFIEDFLRRFCQLFHYVMKKIGARANFPTPQIDPPFINTHLIVTTLLTSWRGIMIASTSRQVLTEYYKGALLYKTPWLACASSAKCMVVFDWSQSFSPIISRRMQNIGSSFFIKLTPLNTHNPSFILLL